MEEKIRILCVDDEKNVLNAIKRLFLDDDYEILTALSGEEGLKILKEVTPIQIVLSDFRMPGMNGVEFLKEVCRQWPDTVRIVISGYADVAAIVSAINEGRVYKFIPKPWNEEDLRVTLSNAVERYHLRKKNRQLADELQKKNIELQRLNEDLDRLVEKRTSELEFQNRALVSSQNILYALPVAVVGFDLNGMIIQCNKEGINLFGENGRNITGKNRIDLLPKEINAFIEMVMEKGTLYGHYRVDNLEVKVKGHLMKQAQDLEGIILVLDCENKESKFCTPC